MSYQVIARKYRPQRFADVVGQEHVSQTLANAIASERIAHAYIFCGPRGTGKTTIARIFAKCLNCTDGPDVEFAEEDEKCIEIAEGRSLDVIEIDGASNNGVEQVRELRETCKFAPSSSRFKIYIIDEVHMLSTAAFNALLKTLEEPPAHVKFIFATTDPEKVLATILSRCQRFDLRRIPAKLIVDHLALIAKQEQVKIDDAALHAIARGADGGMRDAESTLDQLISFCGEEIREEDVLSMFGLTARDQLIGLTRGILAGEVEAVLRELNALTNSGKDLGRLVADLLSHFRNLLIYQVSGGDLELVEVSEAEAAALKEQSELAPNESVTRVMEVLTDYEFRLRDAASKKIMVEVALLKAVQARNAVPLDTVLQKLNDLRGQTPGSNTAKPKAKAPAPSTRAAVEARTEPAQETRVRETPAPAPKPPPTPPARESAPAPVPSAAVPSAPTMPANELNELWHKIVDAARRASPFTGSYLIEGHAISLEKNLLTVGYDPEFSDHLGLVDTSKVHALIQTKLKEMGHAGTQVKFIKSPRPSDFVRPQLAPMGGAKADAGEGDAKDTFVFDKEKFKDDPLIKKALDIFKGEIVDVRA
ncbi:MAG: DNA polymerase III subunit gamma/tau [Verrucomicrobiales bacterium]|nr:DNA polymerase III subunit gamma/tau [Verrucomicrobiales bacterium]